jgi:hypothetical protein
LFQPWIASQNPGAMAHGPMSAHHLFFPFL